MYYLVSHVIPPPSTRGTAALDEDSWFTLVYSWLIMLDYCSSEDLNYRQRLIILLTGPLPVRNQTTSGSDPGNVGDPLLYSLIPPFSF